MVNAGQNPSQGQEDERSHAVQWRTYCGGPKPHGPQMIVLAQHKFNGVDIDGIHVGATGCLLNVMVFVNEWIHGLKVQTPVQQAVYGVEQNVQTGNGQQRVGDCYLGWIYFAVIPTVSKEKIGKGGRVGFGKANEPGIDRS